MREFRYERPNPDGGPTLVRAQPWWLADYTLSNLVL